MVYQLQLLRNLIERHPERAGNLILHVEALERSIEQLPLTCLSNVRAIFEAMQHSVHGVLQITYANDDDFPKRTSMVIKALDLSLTGHPQQDKIEQHLKKLLGSMNGVASSLAALSNIPNLRHGGALDWPTFERQHAYMLGGLCDALVSFLLDVAWSRTSEDGEETSGPSYAAESEFNESLDSEYELVEIAGSSFEPSRVLFALDPIQYESALTEWRQTNSTNGQQEAVA
ncbi:abortive infection family protein [Paracoccus pantotrophus]|uniref:abortive infection family protein n=1 Tax=Paracoccus pantotrophus TaxID=82367 RepID=UPI0008F121D3|nr:abortive infection family protein [Paracoccus pantotrophus]MDF3856630.1 abortive infection family protein [Paracoccus pantotrophus]SFP29258.1 Abortive infection C-terminus [Paracoccus pantotrophus]